MNKWVCSNEPELIPIAKDDTNFDQILAEISTVLYGSYCQLYSNQSKPSPIESKDSLLPGHMMTREKE